MDETKFKVIFSGEIRDHYDLVSVKQRLASLYKAPPKQIDRLFTGKRMVLKSGLSREDAEKFRRVFDHTGAHCEVLPENLESAAAPVPPTIAEETSPVVHIPETRKPQSTIHAPYRSPKSDPKLRKIHPIVWILIVAAILIALYAVMFNFSVRGMRHVAKGSSASAGIPTYSGRLVSYNDPSGFYVIELPPGFSVENTTAGQRSRVTFHYGGGISLSIYARSEPQAWNPDREMQKRSIEILQGKAGTLSNALILQKTPIQLAEASGYQLNLRKGKTLARIIELVNGNNTVFSMTIVAPENEADNMLELLTQTVLEGMTLR